MNHSRNQPVQALGDDSRNDVVGHKVTPINDRLGFKTQRCLAAIAARSMSPVESWGMLYVLTRICAWVPFPAPGGPRNINLIYAFPSNETFDHALILLGNQMALIWLTVSSVTVTMMSSEVPPRNGGDLS